MMMWLYFVWLYMPWLGWDARQPVWELTEDNKEYLYRPPIKWLVHSAIRLFREIRQPCWRAGRWRSVT